METLEQAKTTKGADTREKILAAAERLIQEKGYAGMSLDNVLKETELTKGAFFHHFKNKAELAEAVLQRYARNNVTLFSELSERADRLSDDPLERVMIFLGLFIEFLDGVGKPFPGCIFASYVAERDHFGEPIHQFIDNSLDSWSAFFETKLRALIESRPPRLNVSARSLAELITSTVEGGFIMSNAKNDAAWTQRQLKQCQNYIRLLFS